MGILAKGHSNHELVGVINTIEEARP